MSTCPGKNIHSLYVDNALPLSHKNTFEEHLKACEECSKKVSQYMNMSKHLKSLEVTYDNEEGFKRLKTRQRYKRHIAPYGFTKDMHFALKWTPFIAAAAIVAVLFPVLNLFAKRNDNMLGNLNVNNYLHYSYAFQSMDTSLIAPIQTKGIVADDAIALSKIGTPSQYLCATHLDPSKFTEMDVFKPDVLKENKPINIILFDSPAVVLHETDSFGFSNPVFLLRE